MKFITFYLVLLLLARGVCAQTDQPNDYLDVTPAELNKLLNSTLQTPHGPIIRMQIFASAMATNRLDLIKVCFLNQYTCGETVKAVAEMPDGDLRQRATIAMLRTPNGMFWPAEQQGMDMHGIPPRLLVEPFISVIPQLLPNVKLNENWLKYRIGREKLADDMEAVLNSRNSRSVEEAKSSEPKNSQIAGNVSTAPPSITDVDLKPVSAPNAATTSAANAERHNGVPIFAWVVAGALGIALLLWFIKMKR